MLMGDALGKLEWQQAQQLVGQKSYSTVGDYSGDIILKPGETITHQHIDQLSRCGVLADVYGTIQFATIRRQIVAAPPTEPVHLTPEQRRIAIGSVSAVEIRSPDGAILVAEGETITEPMLDRIEEQGFAGQIRLKPEGLTIKETVRR